MKKAAVCLALLFLAVVLPSLTLHGGPGNGDAGARGLRRGAGRGLRGKARRGLPPRSTAWDDPWHPDTLRGVLEEKHQFPVGNYYDSESLRAAHEALAGRRNLPAGVMYFQSTQAQARWDDTYLYKTVGGLSFYTRDGNR